VACFIQFLPRIALLAFYVAEVKVRQRCPSEDYSKDLSD
jgi:hypothetical protein